MASGMFFGMIWKSPQNHKFYIFFVVVEVFAGFVFSLAATGSALAIIAPVALAGTVAVVALEFLVAFLQAYVFAILTCVYLNDALHPGH